MGKGAGNSSSSAQNMQANYQQQQQQQQQRQQQQRNASQPPPHSQPQQQGGGPQQYPPGYPPSNGQMYGGYGAYAPASQPSHPGGARPPPPQQCPHPGGSGGGPSASQMGPPTQEYQNTETIRNQVNLKKDTLKLEPASETHVRVAFNFDASAASRATVFFNAVEDPKNGCKITCTGSALASTSPPVMFEKGLNMKYISSLTIARAQLSGLAAQVQPSSSFNLIVRLEALTDDAREKGRSLDMLQPGSALNEWVQAQTTYAKVDVCEDGGWVLRVLKQKIWFKGSAYELQEIYGMEQGQVQNLADGFDTVDSCECVICMSAPRDTTALPCRHMCMCHECASALKMQTNKCPICRNEIESLLHIKVAKGLPVPVKS